ncbi:signal peptidase I, Serine peptidase, MEROPS family S26A [Candidatus Ruthia magnifica str. Cm (Calyptogena magnifica)]|uniref:Signal peptidase I n=1 Tax=Ruthia magnifica subsp. Calyptogena magnifica TaxID=413404 RepID=A1AWR3_RUTMC|nr:signal peptidase I [Candidatus Ruthturnera calyptogenae]ABL02370.1 signal peptidase I, Serine peptidase, MEROPS family S26A [Candidatus Ruthia magnifica str. Cm (Calyptogena magnifica)]
MTIENASHFFAWDVSSFLALFLALAFFIVTIDQLFFNHIQTPVTNRAQKSIFLRFLYFSLFLRFNKSEKYLNRPKIVQWSAEFFPVLLLVFLFRGFIIEPFRIPSNSMMPTLLTGDFILVSKFDYGVSIPILNKKIIEFSKPKRGDVVVFRYPNYEKNSKYQGADFIKRVIGIPGDKIIYRADSLYVNDVKIDNKNIGTYRGIESGSTMTGFKHKRELLDNNPHDILLNPNYHSKDVRLTVPEGHYFVMGDNRARSSDSRFWGFVPESYIFGKAFGIWMHWDESLKLDRIGSFD